MPVGIPKDSRLDTRSQWIIKKLTRSRVLTGNELSTFFNDNFLAPILLGPDVMVAAVLGEQVLEREGHVLGQTHGVFFRIGEACHLTVGDEVITVGELDVDDGRWTMADGTSSRKMNGAMIGLY